MAEIKDLKAYVLTTKINSRLTDGKLNNYPSVFPQYEVKYGISVEDNIPATDWYKAHTDIPINHPSLQRYYCCHLSQFRLLFEHRSLHPSNPLLLVEDDAAFEPKFDEYYTNFIKIVPDDWDVISLGGRSVYSDPSRCIGNETVKGVLKPDKLYGCECLLFNSKFIELLLDKYNRKEPSTAHGLDTVINTLIATDGVKMYMPLFPFAYQRKSYSTILQHTVDYSNPRNFSYKDINGNNKRNSIEDLKRYENK